MPDAAAKASALAEHALREAATRAVDEDVKHHLATLADTIRDRPTYHVLSFTEHGWTIMHPLVGCGGSLFECPVNFAAELGVAPAGRLGRYRCHIDDQGRLAVDDEVADA